MTIPSSGRYSEATRALHVGSSYLVSESWHFIKSAMQSIAWSCIAASLGKQIGTVSIHAVAFSGSKHACSVATSCICCNGLLAFMANSFTTDIQKSIKISQITVNNSKHKRKIRFAFYKSEMFSSFRGIYAYKIKIQLFKEIPTIYQTE